VSFLDIPTAYALVGLLYLVMPLMAWAVLAAGRSRTTQLWLGGGVLFGVALLLVVPQEHAESRGCASYTKRHGIYNN
jgi:hypothetical protein